jgi:hypothetical protein
LFDSSGAEEKAVLERQRAGTQTADDIRQEEHVAKLQRLRDKQDLDEELENRKISAQRKRDQQEGERRKRDVAKRARRKDVKKKAVLQESDEEAEGDLPDPAAATKM